MSELTLQQVAIVIQAAAATPWTESAGPFPPGSCTPSSAPLAAARARSWSLMAGAGPTYRRGLPCSSAGSDYRSLNLDRCREAGDCHDFPGLSAVPAADSSGKRVLPHGGQWGQAKEAKAKAKELLASVGISEEQYQRYPANLSGGEQQRVAIARALSSGAGIILADEPTGNLDTANGNQVMEILLRLAHEERALRDRSHPRHGHRRPGRRGLAYEGRGPGSGGVTDVRQEIRMKGRCPLWRKSAGTSPCVWGWASMLSMSATPS